MNRDATHLQKTEHGLAHVKAMSPVMVGDVSVTFPYGVHPSSQDLNIKAQVLSSIPVVKIQAIQVLI